MIDKSKYYLLQLKYKKLIKTLNNYKSIPSTYNQNYLYSLLVDKYLKTCADLAILESDTNFKRINQEDSIK